MNLIFKIEIGISNSLEDLIDDDFIVILESSLLTSNIMKKNVGI
jgi:hypothetical protein